MSNTTSKRLDVPRWVCVFAILLGGAALVIQAAVDIYQGVNASMDWPTWLTQAWQMALPTGFTLVFAAIGGALLNAGRWLVAVALFVLVGCYMAFTATNSMDFVSNATVARTQAQMARQTAAKDIASIQNETTLRERQERHENLWRTYVAARSDRDKERILAQIKDASQEPVSLQTPDISVVPIGVGGTASKYLGWRPEAIQEVKALALPILVMIGKALGITLGFALWPTRDSRSEPDFFGNSTAKTFNSVNYSGRTPPKGVAPPAYKEWAKRDLIRRVSGGESIPSNQQLAQEYSRSEATISEWLKEWKAAGFISGQREGRRNVIGAGPNLLTAERPATNGRAA